MNKKGGKEDQKKYEPLAFYDAKVIVGAAFCVFMCFIIAMAFVGVGVTFERKYEAGRKSASASSSDDTIHILPVSYETKQVSYRAGDVDVDEEDENGYYRRLLKKVGGEEKYYVIRSNTEYENVLFELKKMNATGDDYEFELPEDFFTTSSLILVTAERSNLDDFFVRSLTRDDKYYIHIDTVAEKSDLLSSYGVYGQAIFIKINNIQPKIVEVIDDSEKQ